MCWVTNTPGGVSRAINDELSSIHPQISTASGNLRNTQQQQQQREFTLCFPSIFFHLLSFLACRLSLISPTCSIFAFFPPFSNSQHLFPHSVSFAFSVFLRKHAGCCEAPTDREANIYNKEMKLANQPTSGRLAGG